MKTESYFKRTLTILGSRPARNVYFWIILLWFTHEMNVGNEKIEPRGIIQSSWYWWVILTGLVLQIILVYTNNLLLVPRLLVRRKRLHYSVCVFVLVLLIAVIYTIGLKLAAAHISVNNLQQLGMVSGPISTKWSMAAILDEIQTYFVGNSLWLLIFTMAWYMNDYARQRRFAEQALRTKAETELSFLKSQLNPHFLFNTLNNVYALALKKAEDTPEAILRLSSILRYLLYESNSAMVSAEKEKEIMLAYVDLELLRIRDRERMRFDVTFDRDYMIPPLLWLPVLENVFKHGTRIISKEMFADYSFEIRQDVLTIKAINYCKDCLEMKDNAGGIGLINLNKRLELLYAGSYTIHTNCSDNTFTAEVTIRLT